MRKLVPGVLGPLTSIAFLGGVVLAVLLRPPAPRVQTAQQPMLDAIGSSWAASPGALVLHTVALSGVDAGDMVDLEVSGNNWDVDLPSSVTVDAGGSVTIPIRVAVPFLAWSGMLDRLVLEAKPRASGRWLSTLLVSSTSGEFVGDGYVGCRFDLNRDGKVDDLDVRAVAGLFNVEEYSSRYDPMVDLDHSGRIGAADVQAVAGRVGAACAALPEADSVAFRDAVTVDGLRQHLERLQVIADANGGNRAMAQPGYDASVAYVREQLAAAGYDVATQEFTVSLWEELEPTVLERITPDPRVFAATEYAVFGQSGSGDVTAIAEPIDIVLPPGPNPDTSTSGCEAADFAGFQLGHIALVQRGSCSYTAKVRNAIDAGAAGLIIFNEGQAGRRDPVGGWVSAGTSIPVVGASFAVGEDLADLAVGGAEVTVHLFVQAGNVERPTRNVIAETALGDPSQVVLLGAHLDSVPAGSGINDNGSGSALVLELARQMANLGIVPVNKVRFAFWGAEELGLLGSVYYLDQLSQAERDDIMVNLNFDMVGSPNYVRFVYNGRQMPMPGGANPGSEEIEVVISDYFDGQGLPFELVNPDGRSDHAGFSAAGIAAGGLSTGTSEIKTAAEAAIYGGRAGEPYDACYHQPCDRLDNISWEVLDQLANAAAHVTLVYAMDNRGVINRVPGALMRPALESLEYRGHELQR